MKRAALILLLFFSSSAAMPQENLALQQAIEMALKNNHSIIIQRNNAGIAKNDHSAGNAGFLPSVTLNAATGFSSNDTKQKFTTGTEVDKKKAESQNISSGVSASWTLFDGMKMFATYHKLGELSAMGELHVKIAIENTLAQVINAYYDIVKQEQLLKAIDSTIMIHHERVKIVETSWKAGRGTKMDFLQAKLDRNAQLSAKLKQQTILATAKSNLNQLLARPAETEFGVSDSIPLAYKPALPELRTSVMKQNNSLLIQEKNIRTGDFMLKEVRSQRYPRIALNLNYNFTRTENQAGFILFNQNRGFNTGLTASWVLFNGFNTSRQYKNAQLTLMNYTLQYDETKIRVDAELVNAWKTQQHALQALALEEENIKLAKENMEIALERFKLAHISSLEFKDAQKSYEDALSRLITARYDAKLAETELMRLNGELVK